MLIAIFGLGKFGRQVALEMGRTGHDILVMDKRQELVQAVRDFVSEAVVGDCADRRVLEELGVSRVDAAVVSLGPNMAASILVTLYLRDLEVKKILVKALDDDHADVLTKVGASEVIFPEREMARRLAFSLASPNILDFLPLGPEWAVAEVSPPEELVGSSLRQLDLRRQKGIQVLAIKTGETIKPVIDPELVIGPSDVLVVMGRAGDIEKMRGKGG